MQHKHCAAPAAALHNFTSPILLPNFTFTLFDHISLEFWVLDSASTKLGSHPH